MPLEYLIHMDFHDEYMEYLDNLTYRRDGVYFHPYCNWMHSKIKHKSDEKNLVID